MNRRPTHAANTLRAVHAEVILRPGGLGDAAYPALEIRLPEFDSPYVLTLALPTVVYRALAEQINPSAFYETIANAVNTMSAANESERPYSAMRDRSTRREFQV